MTKIALITGASRGLGAALAEALAPDHHIIAVARTVGGLEELDDRIKAKGGEATLAPMDVTNSAAMQHFLVLKKTTLKLTKKGNAIAQRKHYYCKTFLIK